VNASDLITADPDILGGTPGFWRLYRALPVEVRALARKNYALWSANAFHPSLHFKPVGKPNWSVRAGDRCRAVGQFVADSFVWERIGAHEEHNKRF
jgi:hypothetical protein